MTDNLPENKRVELEQAITQALQEEVERATVEKIVKTVWTIGNSLRSEQERKAEIRTTLTKALQEERERTMQEVVKWATQRKQSYAQNMEVAIETGSDAGFGDVTGYEHAMRDIIAHLTTTNHAPTI